MLVNEAVGEIERLAKERDAAEDAENQAKDCFWAVYPTYVKATSHGISTEAARTELSSRASTAEAKVAELTEALKQIVADYDACSGAEPSLSVLHRSIDVDGRRALEASK